MGLLKPISRLSELVQCLILPFSQENYKLLSLVFFVAIIVWIRLVCYCSGVVIEMHKVSRASDLIKFTMDEHLTLLNQYILYLGICTRWTNGPFEKNAEVLLIFNWIMPDIGSALYSIAVALVRNVINE